MQQPNFIKPFVARPEDWKMNNAKRQSYPMFFILVLSYRFQNTRNGHLQNNSSPVYELFRLLTQVVAQQTSKTYSASLLGEAYSNSKSIFLKNRLVNSRVKTYRHNKQNQSVLSRLLLYFYFREWFRVNDRRNHSATSIHVCKHLQNLWFDSHVSWTYAYINLHLFAPFKSNLLCMSFHGKFNSFNAIYLHRHQNVALFNNKSQSMWIKCRNESKPLYINTYININICI